MANKSGSKTKGSGRKKGTPNKKSLKLEERAKEMGVDFDEMLIRGIAGDWKYFGFPQKSMMIGKAVIRDYISFEMRMEYLFEALPYVKPKLKQVDHSGEIKTSGILAQVLGELEEDELEDPEESDDDE